MSQIIVQLNPDVPPTGSDLGIVNAARKSFGKRSEWEYAGVDNMGYLVNRLKPKDKRLLEFLARGMTADDFDKLLDDMYEGGSKEDVVGYLWQWRNTPTHDTPFNHGFFSFEVKAPIFVARHLVKHEYLIMSEYSRRYITDDVEFYTPDVWRKAAKDVKQGSSDEAVGEILFADYGENFKSDVGFAISAKNEADFMLYKSLIEGGVAPEQARMVLPQSLMTSWTWSGTLGAFASMCKLRLGKDTQAETRIVAEAVYKELKRQFPIAAPLLVEGVL
jgi:thymidylate synthase (FAD)